MHKVCVVYDSVSEAYMRPFFAPATGAAIRSFTDEVNSGNADSIVAMHPADYTLFELGEWDDEKGVIHLYETKKRLVHGLDVKRSDEAQTPLRAAK